MHAPFQPAAAASRRPWSTPADHGIATAGAAAGSCSSTAGSSRTDRPADCRRASSWAAWPTPSQSTRAGRAAPGPPRRLRGRNAFTALNTAFLRDGAFVYVPPGKVVEEPIYLVFSSPRARTSPTVWHRALPDRRRQPTARPRSSRATSAPRADVYFTNAVTEIVARRMRDPRPLQGPAGEPKAFHIATTAGPAGPRPAASRRTPSAWAAAWARNEVNAVLRRRGLRVHAQRPLPRRPASSSSTTTRSSTTPSRTAPATSCTRASSTARPAASSTARSYVRQDAQKTDAKQTNKTLLLSDDATINTKPQLEIYADDVKCTHGATVGQLDDEAIFYLRSRGIGLAGGPRPADLRLRQRHHRPDQGRAAPRASWSRLLLGGPARRRRTRAEEAVMSITGHPFAPRAARPAASAVFDVHARPRGLPDPAAEGPRQAAGLPRQRRHHAEAARPSSTPCAATTSTTTPTSTAASTCSASGPPRPTRRPASRSRTSSTPPCRARSSSSAAAPRRSTSSPRASAGPASAGRRRGPHHRDGAPLQHRPLADAVRGEGGRAARGADQRRRRIAARRVREAADAADQAAWPWSTSPTRWARSTRSSEIIELAHRRGIPVLVDGAQAVPHLRGRRAGAGLRLLRLLRPQGVRADRHRRALRQGAAPGGDAALPGRRRHDPLGHASRRRPTTSCPTSSRPARRTSPAPSAWGRPSITSRRVGRDAIAAHEQQLLRLRHRTPGGRSRACA